MKRLVSLLIIVLLVLLSLFAYGETVQADDVTDKYIAFGSGATIYSPLNKTYSNGALLFNLTFGNGPGLQCRLRYSIDNQNFGEIPLSQVPSTENHIVTRMAMTPVWLPTLKDGSHCLTINVDASGGNYAHSWVHKVYFTVESKAKTQQFGIYFPSGIHLYSPINGTYTQNQLPLNLTFACNTTMGSIKYNISYSLDGKDDGEIVLPQVSTLPFNFIWDVPANLTLPPLPNGEHNLTIYTTATVHADLNMGKPVGDYQPKYYPGGPIYYQASYADTVNFTIADPNNPLEAADSVSPAPASSDIPPSILVVGVIVVVALAAITGAAFLLRYKKR